MTLTLLSLTEAVQYLTGPGLADRHLPGGDPAGHSATGQKGSVPRTLFIITGWRPPLSTVVHRGPIDGYSAAKFAFRGT